MCSSKTPSAQTSLRVIPTFDAAWGIDQIEIASTGHDTKVPDAPAPLTSGISVVVALNDTLAGAPMTLTVSGLHAGAKVAEATVTSTPVAGQNVDVPVTLTSTATPGCPSACASSCGASCEGCACTSPAPAPTCVGSTLRTFATAASCVAGVCTHAPTEGACPAAPANADVTCANGTCDFACKDGYARYGAACFRHDSWTTIGTLPDSLCTDADSYWSWGAAMESDGRIIALAQTENQLAAISDASLSAWTLFPPFPEPRSDYSVTRSVSGSVYVMGGSSGSGTSLFGSVSAYNPAGGKWSYGQPMPTPRAHVALVTGRDGWIYALGGLVRDGDAGPVSAASAAVEAYDPATDRWLKLRSMPTARAYFAAAVAMDGDLFSFGGAQDQATPLDIVQVYSPATDSWSQRAKLPIARHMATGATLADGRILLIGGETNGSDGGEWDARRVDAYDPATNGWSRVANITVGRRFASALTGPDGRVYLVGGGHGEAVALGGCVKEIEVYTP